MTKQATRSRRDGLRVFVGTIVGLLAMAGGVTVALPLLTSLGADL